MARHLIQNATTGDARIVGDAALAFFPGYAVVDTYDDGIPPAVFYGAGESDLRYVNVTELSDPASAASVALRAAFATQDELDAAVLGDYDPVFMSSSNGTDDVAAINAALASGGATPIRVIGKPGQTYRIPSPIVVPSRRVLDFTGCEVVLTSASPTANMITNTAVTPVATAADGSITSGQTTLTTSLAAQAVVGQSVTVTGANANSRPLAARVTAVGTGTITLSVAAGATITGATVSLFNRDQDITIVGGLWRRQNTGSNTALGHHTFRLRRIDQLRVRDVTFATTSNGKYAVSFGDVTDFVAERIHFDRVFSDGVHVNGPAVNGRISDLSGTTGDDMVSLTAADWPSYDDTQGEISGVLVERVSPVNCKQRGVQILPGVNAPIRDVRVRGVYGTTQFAPVQLGDDSDLGHAWLGGGLLSNISIEDVHASRFNPATGAVANGAPVVIRAGNVDTVTVRGIFMDAPSAPGFSTAAIDIDPLNNATYPHIQISDVRIGSIGQNPIVWVRPKATVTNLLIERLYVAVASSWRGVFVGGAVTDLSVRTVTGLMGGGSSGLVFLDSAATTARVDRCVLADLHLVGATAGAIIQATVSTQTVGKVVISASTIDKVYWLANLNTTTELDIVGVAATGGGGPLTAGANAVVALRMEGSSHGGSDGIAVTAGGKVNPKSFGVAVDLSKATRTAGNLATNTNGALACGVGPVVCDPSGATTTWKNVYSGATY